MNRRDLLKALVVAPAVSVVSSALDDKKEKQPHTPRPVGVLRVVLNGPFALVIQKSTPDRLTLFVPTDPDRLHQFYFNNMMKPYDDGQDPTHHYHFTLAASGLWTYKRKNPYIDQCFRDFSFHTDLWQKENYFVTVDVPVPDVIGFIPPTQPVTFKSGKKAMMPLNHVLQYTVTDPDDVKLSSPGRKAASPRPLRELEEEYAAYCKPTGESQMSKSKSESCSVIKHELSGWSEPKASTLYFSVGIPPSFKDDAAAQRHALKFFNEVLLRSFPHLADKQLGYIGDSGPAGSLEHGAAVRSAIWNPDSAKPLLRPVTSAMECKIGGLNVTTP